MKTLKLYTNLRKSKTLSIRASRIIMKSSNICKKLEESMKNKASKHQFLGRSAAEAASTEVVIVFACIAAISTMPALQKRKKSKFHTSFNFFASFPLSVHSALGSFGETYVHSAENTFIRPRIRSSGGEYVHSATFGSRMNRLR